MAAARKTKRCSKCMRYRKISRFRRDRSKKATKDGRKSQCKKCEREYNVSAKGKEAGRRYYHSERGQEVHQRYTKTKGYKEKHHIRCQRYSRSEKGKVNSRAACKRYGQSKKGRATHKRLYHKHHAHILARAAVSAAIKKGTLKRPKICSINNSRCIGHIESHHKDYSKPLKVKWLCEYHHDLADALLRKKGKT